MPVGCALSSDHVTIDPLLDGLKQSTPARNGWDGGQAIQTGPLPVPCPQALPIQLEPFKGSFFSSSPHFSEQRVKPGRTDGSVKRPADTPRTLQSWMRNLRLNNQLIIGLVRSLPPNLGGSRNQA